MNDTEIMPSGTTAEIINIRKLSTELFVLTAKHKSEMPNEVFLKIEEIGRMYVWLNEEYPVEL
jgi:hypothetical protein